MCVWPRPRVPVEHQENRSGAWESPRCDRPDSPIGRAILESGSGYRELATPHGSRRTPLGTSSPSRHGLHHPECRYRTRASLLHLSIVDLLARASFNEPCWRRSARAAPERGVAGEFAVHVVAGMGGHWYTLSGAMRTISRSASGSGGGVAPFMYLSYIS